MAARQALGIALLTFLGLIVCLGYSFANLGRLLVTQSRLSDSIVARLNQENLTPSDALLLKQKIHLFFLENQINIPTANMVLDQMNVQNSEEEKLIIFLMRKVCRPAKLYIWTSVRISFPFFGSFDQPWCLTF